jgi:ferric-dicitrate binding protein FerR (iron transport regulator)
MNDTPNFENEQNELPFGFRRLPVPDGAQDANWKAVEDAVRRLGEGGGSSDAGKLPAIGEVGDPNGAVHAGADPDEIGVGKVRAMGEDSVMQGGEGYEVGGRRRIKWGRIVAAAACVMALAVGVWYTATRTGHPQEMLVRTMYGEIKNVLLPDSSTVVLNANSTLRISDNWNEKQGREVWLEGEAYFQVERSRVVTGQKFTVHTKSLDVEVLGTKFNVKEKAIVEKKALLIMRPGQVVTVDSQMETRVNEDKDVIARSGWSRHEFHFDNTSLGEISRLVEDIYGYKMVLEDTAMAHVAISGDLRVHTVQELVKVLELPSGYRMRIREKTIYVTAN